MSVKPIMKKVLFLSQKAESATSADKQVAIDLLDTLQAHKDGCVGMAANMIGVNKAIIAVNMGMMNVIMFNMIGVNKAIIAVNMGMMNVIMFNPKIVKKAGAFETQEGCLSLSGVRKCTRYREIEVTYQDMNFKTQRQKFSGWIAQIIQHEVDHLSGIII